MLNDTKSVVNTLTKKTPWVFLIYNVLYRTSYTIAISQKNGGYTFRVYPLFLPVTSPIFQNLKPIERVFKAIYRGNPRYRISIISYTTTPPGVRASTLSPALWPKNDFPKGDSFDIFPSAGLASSEPTMTNISSPSLERTRTVAPTTTVSVRRPSAINTTFRILSSMSAICVSTSDCSSLVS